jgi:hypothetical protein
MKRSIVSMIVILTFVLVGRSTPAEARTVVELTKVTGTGVIAEWFITDTENDTFTFVNIITTLNATVQPPNGAATEEPLTVVSITQSTLSTFEVLIDGFADTTDFIFTVDKNLKNANLQASLEFQNVATGVNFPLTVNMNWIGTRPFNDHSHSNIRDFDGLRIIENFNGRHRQAIATGSVEGLGIEFTPVASSTAEIQINRSGTLTIEKIN